MSEQDTRFRILTIDDSPVTRKIIIEALRNEPYDVDTAGDGMTAISKIKSEPVDLITLDVEMPGLHGIEVLRIVKKIDPDIVVIMVTNLDNVQTAIRSIRQGAYDYITKPFSGEDMVLSIKRGLEQRRLTKENRRLVEHLKLMNEELEEKVRIRTHSLELSKRQLQQYAGELEQKNRQLEDAYRKLQELDKLKSEFITVASHELRTPLVAIQGYNTILLREKLGPLTERQRKGLEVSETNIGRLTNIVRDILDVARIDSMRLNLRPSTFSVGELLAQMCEEMRPLVERRSQSIGRVIPEDLPCVYGDRNRIVQVMSNLVLNAIRFTPDGGSITLGASPLASPEARFVELWVRDSGIGIDEKYFDRIFERFYEIAPSEHHSSGTIEFKSGGTGLGLSIVKGIVEQHGGQVRVESELSRGGQGTTFVFSLPRGDLEPLPQLTGVVQDEDFDGSEAAPHAVSLGSTLIG